MRTWIGRAAWIVFVTAGVAAAVDEKREPTPVELATVAEKLAPSLVRVEYTLQYDQGEEPQLGGWVSRCPHCGGYHGHDVSSLVSEERPLEMGGFVLSPTRVVAPDLMIHPRFVKRVAVRAGDEAVEARIVAYGMKQCAVVLETAKPLPGVTALEFKADAKPPYYAVSCDRLNAEWTISVTGVSPGVSVAGGRRLYDAHGDSLIADRSGVPVGVCMTEGLPTDDSWKGSPNEWPLATAAERTAWLDALEKSSAAAVVRVRLGFRSPQAQESRFDRHGGYGYSSDEDGDATERDVIGVVVDAKRVLVLASLDSKVTARLERVTVHVPGSDGVAAKFVASLEDYGGLVVETAEPMSAPAKVAPGNILSYRERLLPSAEVRLHGENRIVYLGHARFVGFELGWREHVYPQIAGQAGPVFVFDTDGALVALPISRRQKVTVREQWSSQMPVLTAATDLVPVLADLSKHSDANNIPLTEEEENRLAWFGVELQALTRELARVNKVSHLTQDGQFGAIVTYVYPGSPAAEAGIEPGDILIRLHAEGQPKPLELSMAEDLYGMDSFPWEQLGDVPAEYFDRLPTPWPSAENSFTRALTDLGFGKKFTAEYVHEGKEVRKPFTVVQGPPHYNSARRFKSESLGMTVRDLTYEVRRYFQKPDDDPGVIVSKVEPGGKAAVGGIVPYEIITHVNRKAVANTEEFAKAIEGQDELRLSVKRRARGRVVRIKMPPTTQKAADDDASKKELPTKAESPGPDDGAEATPDDSDAPAANDAPERSGKEDVAAPPPPDTDAPAEDSDSG